MKSHAETASLPGPDWARVTEATNGTRFRQSGIKSLLGGIRSWLTPELKGPLFDLSECEVSADLNYGREN